LALLSGCRGGGERVLEVNYVSAPQAFLRDRVAAVYNKTGNVKNADRVDVLDHDRRFAKVRTASGVEGWIEQRFLVPQSVFDGFQQLAKQQQNSPVEATGTTRNETNLHLTPGRDTDHLYLLDQGAKVSMIQRQAVEKAGQAKVTPPPGKTAPAPIMEDWWLVKTPEGQFGWLLGRMIDVDVPLDIAQYAEGQRIVAFFELNEVPDSAQSKKVGQYLVALSEPRDGMPFDYNQIRVFTWNTHKHRYETAYREHDLNGVLPITVGQENFEKEGMLPTFTLHVQDDSGKVSERKYKLNTPIVRRVYAPGEEPARATPKKRRR
jgi:hypothetical protein